MPSQQDAGSQTVRIDAELARMLQTISALSNQMGERFKSVEFLNGLVRERIVETFENVTARFADFQKKKKRPKS